MARVTVDCVLQRTPAVQFFVAGAASQTRLVISLDELNEYWNANETKHAVISGSDDSKLMSRQMLAGQRWFGPGSAEIG